LLTSARNRRLSASALRKQARRTVLLEAAVAAIFFLPDRPAARLRLDGEGMPELGAENFEVRLI
jgi:hypothetical protein